MDPLIATMDQSSLGNKNKKLSSGPNTKEQSSKLLQKTDQPVSSPVIPKSPSSVVTTPSSFGANFTPKNNRHSEENHRRKNNHREHDDPRSRDTQKPPASHDVDDYDDNKDVVVVKDLKNHDTNTTISKQIETLSISGTELNNANQSKRSSSSRKESEGTSRPSQIQPSPPPPQPHPIAPNRTTTTTTTCTDIVAENRDLSEACHHQPPSSLPTSAFPQDSRRGAASNGGSVGSHPGGGRPIQQRRQPPIIKAQSLDFACDDDAADQVHSHLQNHYLFQNNHHHHRTYLHHQHLHHFNHIPSHHSSSSGRKQKTINAGCFSDHNQRSEDEDGLRSANTPTTEDADADADVDEDDDDEVTIKRAPTLTTNALRSHTVEGDTPSSLQRPAGSFDSTSSMGDTTDSSQQTDAMRLSSPQPRQHSLAKGILPKVQSLESRPIYPNVPYSPYASPYGSPRSNRRRTPLRESRRISIEQSGSFLQLNQYKLMDQIGQGSYGLVKLAYSEEDSTHYAMKILSKRRLLRKAGLMSRGPKKTTSPLDRVYREIAVLKKLDHPNVVKLIEVLDDPLEDSLYLVFELVKQGEVLSIPTEKPLTEERTWSVFRDAVQGLEYLHYQRIIHADIKPGNLLLTECGHVKIADLGVCNEFLGEDATMNNGSTAGTPAFRAPETLFPGQHLYSGKAADIWALGATLYSLVYGNVPFVASSVPLLYEKIKNETLMIPEKPAMSEELVDLIRKMLTKDPAKRITLPQIKEHPWVTANGVHILPSEDDNCRLVQVSEEDINSVVKSIPKLDTLILIKTMLKNHSFLNPFSRGISGRAPQRGGSRLERFSRAGRSNSAPGAYHSPIDRQLSGDCILPALSEHGVSSSSDIPEDS